MGSSDQRFDPAPGTDGRPPADPVFEAAVRQHLEKLASSRAFANAHRLSRFLRFVVEARLAGSLDRIQEYVIGLEVFGRKETFDPRTDSIVRVEARRLRLRLKEYYRTEGRNETVRVELPKRGYIPNLRTRVSRKRSVRLFWAAGACAVLLLGTLAVLHGRRSVGGSRAPVPGSDQIGVLPFANLSGDPDLEYFADGITDALITELARIRGLRVISRTSMMRHKGSRESAPAIARELGARYLLEGGVFRSGRRVRITAQLIDAAKDEHIWAGSYEREITDILRLQGELVRQIARETHVQLAPEVERTLTEAPSVHEKAYDAYLKGRFALEQRTEEAAGRSAKFFEEAISEEPGFAPAHTWLAAAYRMRVVMGDVPPEEGLPRAMAAARRGVDLAPLAAEARFSLAACHALQWNWPTAGHEFRRALELDPRSSEARHGYAILYLAPLGRLDEAEVEIRRAVDLDRTSLNNRVILGKILYFQRKYGRASAELEQVLAMDPNYSDGLRNLGAAYVQRGMHEEAVAAYRKAQSLSRITWGEGLLAHALAASGRRTEAARIVRELTDRVRRTHASPQAIAAALVGLGDLDGAFFWLEHARAGQDWRLMFLKVDPLYDPLRSDPRFSALIKAVGL